MIEGVQRAAQFAAEVAGYLPEDDLSELASAVLFGADSIHRFQATATSGLLRSAAGRAVQLLANGVGRTELSSALVSAGLAYTRIRLDCHVDIVWTGPHSDITSHHITSHILRELINSAREDILLVCYALRPQAEIVERLSAAKNRGVFITCLAERQADNPHFTGEDRVISALVGKNLAWPQGRRHKGASLHAKIMVIDRTVALVGSANFTESGIEKNLECGVVIRGGNQPEQIHDHIMGLYNREQLISV
ncbi:MAG: DISARM system phospholipase D-like protein DrmC [Angustibacter sp.]